jgi:hypothetical protein
MGSTGPGLSFQGIQTVIPSPVASDIGPSLAVYALNNDTEKLYAAWKGAGGDERIWWSTFDGTSWSQQQSMPDPFATAYKPALAVVPKPPGRNTAPRLYAAWRGADTDERIWYSYFNGEVWVGQLPIPDPVASSVGPSLAVVNNILYAAWKGSGNDQRLWWSTFDGTKWTPQQQFPDPIASSIGPSLTVYDGILYAAWKGSGFDTGLYYSHFDSNTWADQTRMPNPIASTVGPSLTVYNGVMYAAWKGSGNDQRIWYTAYGPQGFDYIGPQPNGPVQMPLPNPIGSSIGPSITPFNGRLYFAWKGTGGDYSIYWTTASTG